jgi:hypothetical protein
MKEKMKLLAREEKIVFRNSPFFKMKDNLLHLREIARFVTRSDKPTENPAD